MISDKVPGLENLSRTLGQEQTERTVKDARADAGNPHGRKPA